MSKTFTLSRAHKLVERLTRERDKIFEEISGVIVPLTVNVQGDENRADEGKAEFARLLKLAAKIGTAKDAIRDQISMANSKIGIHTCLFKKADLLAELKAYKELLQASLYNQANAIEQDQVPAYMARISGMTSMQQVKVKVFTDSMKQELLAKIDQLQRLADKVGDDINDLNANKITVNIDDDVAEMIGL
jgi:uncharacterized protein YjbJ (UPF0337 family)